MSEIVTSAYAERLGELAGNLVNARRFSGQLAVAESTNPAAFQLQLLQLNSEHAA